MHIRTRFLLTTLLFAVVAIVAVHSTGLVANSQDNNGTVVSNARAPAGQSLAALPANASSHYQVISARRTDHARDVLGMATTSTTTDDCNLLGLAAVVTDRAGGVNGMGVVTYIQNGSQEWFSPDTEIWFTAQNGSPPSASSYLRDQFLNVSSEVAAYNLLTEQRALSTEVHLPAMNFQGQNDVNRTWIDDQNGGDDFSKAALTNTACGQRTASGLSTFHQGMSLALLEHGMVSTANRETESLESDCQKLNEKQVEDISFDAWGYLNSGEVGGALVDNDVNMTSTSRTIAWSAPASRSGGGAETFGMVPNSANDNILVSAAMSGFLPDTYTVASSSRTDTPNARKSQVRQTLLLSTSTSQAVLASFAFSSYQLLT